MRAGEADKRVIERGKAFAKKVSVNKLKEWRKPDSRRKLKREIEYLMPLLCAIAKTYACDSTSDDRTINAMLDYFFMGFCPPF